MEGIGNEAHKAVNDAAESLSPETPNFGPLTPDEIQNLVRQGEGQSVLDAPLPPTAQPVFPPQAAPYTPPQMQQLQQAPPPQYVPPQQMFPPAPQYDPRDARIHQLEAEVQSKSEAAARAQAYEQWLLAHPEVVEAAERGAQPAPGSPPEDPVISEVRKYRNEMQRELGNLREQTRNAQNFGRLSLEAGEILREWGPGVPVKALAEYCRDRGIPTLREGLAHAAGELALNAYKQQVPNPWNMQQSPLQQQQQQYQQRYQQPAPQQQQFQGYPQQYQQPPQPYTAQTNPPSYEPPPPNGAMVMRPGMAPPSNGGTHQAPARSNEEMFSRIDQALARAGFQ